MLIYRWRPLLHGFAGLLALAFSRPTDLTNLVALAIVLAGAGLRIWALVFIRKGEELCTTGPYALVRHPLYLGDLVVIAGIVVAMNSLAAALIAGLAMAALYAGASEPPTTSMPPASRRCCRWLPCGRCGR